MAVPSSKTKMNMKQYLNCLWVRRWLTHATAVWMDMYLFLITWEMEQLSFFSTLAHQKGSVDFLGGDGKGDSLPDDDGYSSG